MTSEIQKNKYFAPHIDSIRGFAILAVFLFHVVGLVFGFDKLPWNGWFRNFSAPTTFLMLYPLTYGSYGVAIFFVVSGFCIHLSFLSNPKKCWINFAERRFFRIYPPYLFAFLLFFFVWPWGNFSDFSEERVGQFITHLLAIHNIDERYFFGVNPSFWSIAVELQLYAIYPLLIWICNRFGFYASLLTAAILETGFRSYSSFSLVTHNELPPRWLHSNPFAFWFSWSLGAYVADCYAKGEVSSLSRLKGKLLGVVALALPLFKPTSTFGFLAFSLTTAVFLSQILSGKVRIPTDNAIYRHLSELGKISFSFYLIHQPLLYLFSRIVQRCVAEIFIHPLWMFIALVCFYPIVFWLAKLQYAYVEMPSLMLGKKIIR